MEIPGLQDEGMNDLILIAVSSGFAIILKLLDIWILSLQRRREKAQRDTTVEITTEPPVNQVGD